MFSQDGFKRKESKDVMYRSNSSLELVHTEQPAASGLRREYGSHGSIDVIGGSAGMPHNKSRGELAADHADGPTPRLGASPKLRNKFQKLWGGNGHNIPKVPLDDVVLRETFTQLSVEVEHAKRRNFAHYDCQSLMANLGYAAELRGALLSRRRNTTTGASAASLLASRGSMPDNDALPDTGDGRSNDLLESCPFFRNELGGEFNF
ncbi:Signal-induced proliferation-associated 1-like protein 2 [Eumeta japonica]|uniref:Signal-induced proliferation-associated 1-like protein 2 n=1 Tax=Eumeta variegata TaxID=151549 RepID=A0A4C1XM68_EUMVA|nr:Signal-induced proliferation-associated 1-like protein 2 [Eumeta japonica]